MAAIDFNSFAVVTTAACSSPKQDLCRVMLQGGPGVPEKRLQWALRRLSSLEGRVLQLESSAAAR